MQVQTAPTQIPNLLHVAHSATQNTALHGMGIITHTVPLLDEELELAALDEDELLELTALDEDELLAPAVLDDVVPAAELDAELPGPPDDEPVSEDVLVPEDVVEPADDVEGAPPCPALPLPAPPMPAPAPPTPSSPPVAQLAATAATTMGTTSAE